jgi:hypothetical protein
MSAMVRLIEHVIRELNLIGEPLEELLDAEVRAYGDGAPEDEDLADAYIQLRNCADAYLKLHMMKRRMEGAAWIQTHQEEA